MPPATWSRARVPLMTRPGGSAAGKPAAATSSSSSTTPAWPQRPRFPSPPRGEGCELLCVEAGCRRDAIRLVNRRRLDVERVRETNEQAEYRRHVRGLGDLLVGPARIAQAPDL